MTDIDPFAGAEKSPALSFHEQPVGTTYEGVVTDTPKLLQSKDYNTGDPKFWPAKPGQEPNPVMSVVVNLDVEGEPRSLWAQKPSAMFMALAEAQKTSGIKIGPGVKLAVRFTGEKPHTDPEKIRKKLPPQKLYAVKLEAAPPEPAADPFAGSAGDDAPPW